MVPFFATKGTSVGKYPPKHRTSPPSGGRTPNRARYAANFGHSPNPSFRPAVVGPGRYSSRPGVGSVVVNTRRARWRCEGQGPRHQGPHRGRPRSKLSFPSGNFLQNRLRLRTYARIEVSQIVAPSFVFIYIPGSTFIFNIFLGWSSPMSDFLLV